MKLAQEEIITFEKFDNKTAFQFGQKIIAKTDGKTPVRIRVYFDGDIVFQYLETGKKTDEWLNRKQFIVMATGHSSLYVFKHQTDFPALSKNPQVIHTGGGYPLYVDSKLRGCFVVSGLEHTQDHQLIIDTLTEMKLN